MQRVWGGLLVVGTSALAAAVAFDFVAREPKASADLSLPLLPGQGRGVLMAAHESVGHAFADFFGARTEPEQPFEFPHNIHIAKRIQCTACHRGVATGPVAGLPGVRTCLVCHRTTARDRPAIKEMTDMSARGFDFAWERVYGYPDSAHVRFNHAPHIRAEVECATCHGDIANQTVAQRNVELSMGFCLDCHQERQASIDCLTCHY